MIMWVMSDRAIPRSFRFMEGFGVHTFRFVNAEGEVDVREVPLEAEAGDAVGAVGRGGEDQRRRSRLPPPRPVGRDRAGRLPGVGTRRPALRRRVRRHVRLRRSRPDQAHPGGARAGPSRSGGWCSTGWSTTSSPRPSRSRSAPRTSCPGIDFTNDPLLQGRNFSYLDTQLKRLGGPNFTHIPINAPKCPFAHFQQDGHMAMRNPVGRVNYEPNSLAGERRAARGSRSGGSRPSPRTRRAEARLRPESFADHYSQAAPVLPQPDAGRAAAHRRRLHVRAQQGETARHPRAHGGATSATSTRTSPPRSATGLGLARSPAATPAAAARTNLRCVAGVEHPRQRPDLVRRSQGRSPRHRRRRRHRVVKASGGQLRPKGPAVEVIAPPIGGVTLDDGARSPPIRWSAAGHRSSTTRWPCSRRRRRAQRAGRRLPAAKDFVTDAHAHCKVIGHTPPARALFEAAGLGAPSTTATST